LQRRRDAASATGIDEAWASLKSFPARYTDLPPGDGSDHGGWLTTHSNDGHLVSQQNQKRMEDAFRWVKTVGGERKLRDCPQPPWAEMAIAGYNLVRLEKLTAATT
jgi:hypothetical protein